MNEQRNTQTARRAYDFFKAGDIESLINLYTDDATFETPETENVPHGGKRQGKEQIWEFMRIVGENLESLHFEPRQIVAQNETTVTLGEYRWRVKSTGKEFTSDFVHVNTFDDVGKMTSFKEYADTAKARDAYTMDTAQSA
jgi:hypothetical protein